VRRLHRHRDEEAATEPRSFAAPQPPLLDLQRSAGNAAVGRMLARQQAPRRIDRHDILISTARGPILHEHGGYEWYVRFGLPFEADADGFIIQELYQESSEMPQGGDHFWECWRVRAGSRTPSASGEDYDDRYVNRRVGDGAAASGWNRHTGVARFYPGPLPAEFGSERAGADFYVTGNRPAGWTGAGSRHDCYGEWDTARGRNGLVAYAGSDELRRGTPVRFRPRAS
jgi:hypothetical protein